MPQIYFVRHAYSKYDFYFWKTLEMPDIYKLTFDEGKFIAAVRIEISHPVNNL